MIRFFSLVFPLVLFFDALQAFAGGGEQHGGITVAGNSDYEVSSAASTAAKGTGNELRRLLGKLESLRADFVQRVEDTDGFEIQSMSGRMTVARPGKIHWQTRPPYEQLLISDAETLWLYDKDLEQVTVRPFSRDIVDSPAMLFIGDLSELETRYSLLRSGGEQGVAEFALVPKDASSVYRKLTIRFVADLPQAMAMWDSLGQVTHIEFSSVELNPQPADTLFVFDIPDGVDVLYND